jgi:hypothetical protein
LNLLSQRRVAAASGSQGSEDGPSGCACTIGCDATELPYRSGVFDAVICIAVLHHLSTVERRLDALTEMVRVCRQGALIMVQVWALEQEEGSKRRFEQQDALVPWQFREMGKSYAPVTTWDTVIGSKDEGKEQRQGGQVQRHGERQHGATQHGETQCGENQQGGKQTEQQREEQQQQQQQQPPLQQGSVQVYQRYCHMYQQGELEGLCALIQGAEILHEQSGKQRSNWQVVLRKL